MAKIDLSISTEYVKNWGIIEAVREIFQNALDQSAINPDNKVTWDYDSSLGLLTIGSKDSVLERESLLLGHSTKRDNSSTIGQFGEGYKLALMVLLRNNRPVEIHNYSRKELWTADLVHSKAFNQTILQVKIKKHIFTSVPDSDLTFVIHGITSEDMARIRACNLHMDHQPDCIASVRGRILLNERYAKQIFINGLYVETHSSDRMVYGYDLNPEFIPLDRDRKMVRDLDLFWLTSDMWLESQNIERLEPLLVDEAIDVDYVVRACTKPGKDVSNAVHQKFVEQYGLKAVPVTSQKEFDELKKLGRRYKPVFVSRPYSYMITNSPNYSPPVKGLPIKRRLSPAATIKELLDDNGKPIPGAAKRLPRIYEISKQWMWKPQE